MPMGGEMSLKNVSLLLCFSFKQNLLFWSKFIKENMQMWGPLALAFNIKDFQG